MGTKATMGLFGQLLQEKVNQLKSRATPITLGRIQFRSPLLLAPMSAICTAPFRLLMQELGAGGTVSELISCHGINHGNQRTMDMLKLHPKEQGVGLQLFGEDAQSMAKAARVAQGAGPDFIDINMGCPVKKVVSKGGGSALLKETASLGHFFSTIKRELTIPLTIKIRTGWDADHRNAHEVIRIAKEEGVEFVAIHGRTRTQQYSGEADWTYLEDLGARSALPLIGNGDLHHARLAQKRLAITGLPALMLGRGPLRNPFIFLESFLSPGEVSPFTARDYLEIIEVLFELMQQAGAKDRTLVIQMRKHVMWFAAGFPGASHFRSELFTKNDLEQTLALTRAYFTQLEGRVKQINYDEAFMTSGHG
jgi:tRNA-dihydrouridine synthase B